MNSFDDILHSDHLDFAVETSEHFGVGPEFSSKSQRQEFPGGSSPERSTDKPKPRRYSKTTYGRREAMGLTGRGERRSVENIARSTAEVAADTAVSRVAGELESKTEEAAKEGAQRGASDKVEEVRGRVDSLVGDVTGAAKSGTQEAMKTGEVQDPLKGALADVAKGSDVTETVKGAVKEVVDPTDKSKSWLGRKIEALRELKQKFQSSSILMGGLIGQTFIDNTDTKRAIVAGAIGAAVATVASGEVMKRKMAEKKTAESKEDKQ